MMQAARDYCVKAIRARFPSRAQRVERERAALLRKRALAALDEEIAAANAVTRILRQKK